MKNREHRKGKGKGMKKILDIINNVEFSNKDFIYVATYEFDSNEEFELMNKAVSWIHGNKSYFEAFDDGYECGLNIDGVKLITSRWNGYSYYSINEINHMNDGYYQFAELGDEYE